MTRYLERREAGPAGRPGLDQIMALPARGPGCSILLPLAGPCLLVPRLLAASVRRRRCRVPVFLASLAYGSHPLSATQPRGHAAVCRALQLNARWMDRTPRRGPHNTAVILPFPRPQCVRRIAGLTQMRDAIPTLLYMCRGRHMATPSE